MTTINVLSNICTTTKHEPIQKMAATYSTNLKVILGIKYVATDYHGVHLLDGATYEECHEVWCNMQPLV